MASRVQKIKLWDTFKNAKSVILHFFPVAEIGRNIHLLYFSYPQQIYSQFVEWGKKVLSPYSPQWSVYFPVLLLLITRKHPVDIWCDRDWWQVPDIVMWRQPYHYMHQTCLLYTITALCNVSLALDKIFMESSCWLLLLLLWQWWSRSWLRYL